MVIQSFDEAFNVVWDDPAHANESWVLDRLHWPSPMAPLYQALHFRIMRDAFLIPAVFVNGYGFARNFGPPPASPEVNERGAIPVWEQDYLPQLLAGSDRLRHMDYDSMPAPEVAAAMGTYLDTISALFRFTTVNIFAFLRPTALMVAYLEADLGEDGPELASRLLQGYENVTSASGFGLTELSELATASPELSAALQAGRFDDLASLKGGPAFLEKLDAYLDAYGWRAETWGAAHQKTWLEDRSIPLGLIGRYLADPSRSPGTVLQRSRAGREAALAEVESRLAPEKLPRFRELRDNCADHLAISEGRAFWQLALIGLMRLPALALGRKLAEAGVIAEPNDVFFLYETELTGASKPGAPAMAVTVAQRKQDLERQQRLMPPTFIGVAPSMATVSSDMASAMRHFRGYGVEASKDPNVLTGTGASKGIVTGRARVLAGLHEADRLQNGDILVCRTTAPPWTPLFSIAGGIVTDGGGILSHSAICAREYGIPCVVGTQTATQRIPDGALLTIDGVKGTVYIQS